MRAQHMAALTVARAALEAAGRLGDEPVGGVQHTAEGVARRDAVALCACTSGLQELNPGLNGWPDTVKRTCLEQCIQVHGNRGTAPGGMGIVLQHKYSCKCVMNGEERPVQPGGW